MMPICYVYVMECESPTIKPIKIGVANSPERRIEELQTGCPWSIKLKTKIPMPSRAAALDLESFLHSRFAKRRMEGEWFNPKKCNMRLALEHYEKVMRVKPIQEDVNHLNKFGSKKKTDLYNEIIEEKLDSLIDLSWI